MRRVLITLGLLVLLLTYATVRYVVLKGVSPAHLPLYVGNKAVALLALGMLGLACSLRRETWGFTRRWTGRMGLALAVLHVLMSLPLLTPAMMDTLYLPGRAELTFQGEAVLLLGALALVTLLAQGWLALEVQLTPVAPGVGFRAVGWTVLALGAAHCAALGWSGWWRPSTWPGGMPPITLLAVGLAAAAALHRLLRR